MTGKRRTVTICLVSRGNLKLRSGHLMALALFASSLVLIILFIMSPMTGAQEKAVTFSDLEPILTEHCIVCHGEDDASLELRLDSLENLLKGSTNGPVVTAGDPSGSELIKRIKGISEPRMPLLGPPYLSDSEIKLFEQWVSTGLSRSPVPTPKTVTAAVTGSETVPLPTVDVLTRDTGAVGIPPEPIPVTPQDNVSEALTTKELTYTQIMPLLGRKCVKCHMENGVMGSAPEGYLLTSWESTLSRTDRLRVVAGKPGASEFYRRLSGQARPQMPFDGPPFLNDNDVSLLRNWIVGGALNGDGSSPPDPSAARVRLHGTLSSRWVLDDLPLMVTANTRIDKSPDSGDYVEVRGTIDPGIQIRVERLRRK